MAGESAYKYGTEVTLEESGASTADGVFTAADDANLLATDQELAASSGEYYDRLRLRLTTVDTTVNPDIGGTVDLYARVMNIEGTGDAPVPNANYRQKFVASFPIDDDQALTQHVERHAANPFPGQEQEYYIENAIGQTISAGWNLRVTPYSLVARQ